MSDLPPAENDALLYAEKDATFWSQECGYRTARVTCRVQRRDHGNVGHDFVEATSSAEKDALVKRAVRTLLPGLRAANYVERWSPGSPAVQALSILSEWVDEEPMEAGDLIQPDVPTAHVCRPEGRVFPPGQWDEEADAMFIDKAREATSDAPPAQCRGGIHSLSPPLERCTLVEGHEGECQ